MKNLLQIAPNQILKANEVVKIFHDVRKKAKKEPQYITENDAIDSVLVDYNYFVAMYERLAELEAKEQEEFVICHRIERLEKDPTIAIPWKTVRRTK